MLVGVFFGGVSFLLPLSGRFDSTDAGRWVALGAEQFGTQIDTSGWSMVGLAVALLGMVVAIVAFVGMRDASVASQRRREVLIEAAGYLILLATAVSTITMFAILLSAFPVTLLRSLSAAGASGAFVFDDTINNTDAGTAIHLQSGQALLGFIGLGLLGVCRHLDATLRVWAANEEDSVAVERTLFADRIRDRSTRLARVKHDLSRIRPSPSRRSVIIGGAWLTAIGIMIAATAAATITFTILRGMNGLDVSDWPTLALGSAALASAQVLFTSIAYRSLRKSVVAGPELEGRTIRRWKVAIAGWGLVAVIATLALPGLITLLLLTSSIKTNPVAVATFDAIVFALPSAALWFRRGKYSWNEAALTDVARALRSSIHDDCERLNTLVYRYRDENQRVVASG